MGVKLLPQSNGESENRCWGEYLDQREKKQWEAEESCKIRSFKTCKDTVEMTRRKNKQLRNAHIFLRKKIAWNS
jgi:hypothetical protein